MERRMSKDELVQTLWGDDQTYRRLSPWGKKKVDQIHHAMFSTPLNVTGTTLPVPDNLRAENLRLTSQLEQAKIENLELWDENEELRLQVLELQTQTNPS